MQNNKTKILRLLLTTLAVSLIIFTGWFFSTYQLRVQSPVNIKFQPALVITKRLTLAQTVVITNTVTIEPNDSIEDEICQKFGSQCREALEIQHLEDGTEQLDRLHINTGKNSFDVGLMQIDSQHIGETIDGHTITLAELTTREGNINDAYLIYKHSGWGAWSTWVLIPTNLK